MALDLLQEQLDVRVRAAGAPGRLAVHEAMYRDAFRLVWAQADRAGEMSELERARYLLRRLYPDLEGPRLESIMVVLEAEWAAGTWSGFRRPPASAEAAAVSGSRVEEARTVSPASASDD